MAYAPLPSPTTHPQLIPQSQSACSCLASSRYFRGLLRTTTGSSRHDSSSAFLRLVCLRLPYAHKQILIRCGNRNVPRLLLPHCYVVQTRGGAKAIQFLLRINQPSGSVWRATSECDREDGWVSWVPRMEVDFYFW